MVCRSESHNKCCAAPPAPATHGRVLQDAAACHARACSALGAVRRWPSLAACPCWAALSAPLTPQSARSIAPCLDQASLAFARRVAQSCSCMQGATSVRDLMFNAAPHRPTIPHRPSIHAPITAQASTHPLARPPGEGRHSSLHMLYRHSAASKLRCAGAALGCAAAAPHAQPGSAAGCSGWLYARPSAAQARPGGSSTNSDCTLYLSYEICARPAAARARTERSSARKVSRALHSRQSTVFSVRLPLTVKMSPKYVKFSVLQLGQGPCARARASL